MNQNEFDEAYNKGIESNKISLTNSKTITVIDLLDSAIYRLYYQDQKSTKEIKQILHDALKNFKNDFKEESL